MSLRTHVCVEILVYSQAISACAGMAATFGLAKFYMVLIASAPDLIRNKFMPHFSMSLALAAVMQHNCDYLAKFLFPVQRLQNCV